MKRVDERGDLRTLKLANPELLPEQLEAYLVYQRSLAEGLVSANGPPESAAFVEGHVAALSRSGLIPRELEAVRSIVRRYAGVRVTLLRLQCRLAALTGQSELSREETERVGALKAELQRLEASLGQRDSAGTLALLASREAEVVSLHQKLGSLG